MAKKKALTITEEEFPGNSSVEKIAPIREERNALLNVDDPRPPLKEVKQMPKGRVMRKKKTFVQSVAETLVGSGSDSIGSYILYEVLLPAFKGMVKDAVTGGVEKLLGESVGSSSRRDKERSSISYGKYFDRKDERRVSRRDRFGLNDIYFKDHEDAEEILDRMCERLEDYEELTVAEFFDMANIDGATWAHEKYGWTNLKRARLTHTRHGYAIILPEPEELE